MRIERVRAAAGGERHIPRDAQHAGARQAQGDERVPGQARGTALVAVNSAQQQTHKTQIMHGRATSPFVAQLLANHMGLAQTRQRRRLNAGEASERYNAADALDEWQIPGQLQTRFL